MMKQQLFEPNRRRFLRRVTLGSGAGLVLGAGIGLPLQSGAAQVGRAADAGADETSRGYHLTEHIREYYRKAAF